MEEEQVIRSEPHPSVVNDNKSEGEGGGELFYDFLIKELAFWMERAAAFLVVFCVGGKIILNRDSIRTLGRAPSDVWFFLAPAFVLLFISNFLYNISSYINSQVIRAEPHPPSEAGHNKSQGGGGVLIKDQETFWLEQLAAFSVFLCWVSTHEICRLFFCNLALSSFIATNGNYIGCYLYAEYKIKRTRKSTRDVSLKESKEEEKAQDKRDNTGKETTGQQKAKIEVSLKESKEEARSNSEEFQSVEAKYLAKIEKRVDLLLINLDKFHGWEEERSQLMYELGAARASFEIYRDLLHDVHYHP